MCGAPDFGFQNPLRAKCEMSTLQCALQFLIFVAFFLVWCLKKDLIQNLKWWQCTHISAQTTWPILYTPTATIIRHAIGSARRPAPTTLFHVRGRNLATELSLWPGQSCGTVCQRQFVTRTVYTLLNADTNHIFLACVLMIDSVMPFRSGFAHGRH